MRDTFDMRFTCEDCGRDDHLSINAMLNCNCDRYDAYGYPKEQRGEGWLP